MFVLRYTEYVPVPAQLRMYQLEEITTAVHPQAHNSAAHSQAHIVYPKSTHAARAGNRWLPRQHSKYKPMCPLYTPNYTLSGTLGRTTTNYTPITGPLLTAVAHTHTTALSITTERVK